MALSQHQPVVTALHQSLARLHESPLQTRPRLVADPLWRRLALPLRVGNRSLTSLQQRLVKTGGRLIKHARYYWLLLAEGHLTRRLFGSMLRRITALPLSAG